jgi:flagellar protein FlaG
MMSAINAPTVNSMSVNVNANANLSQADNIDNNLQAKDSAVTENRVTAIITESNTVELVNKRNNLEHTNKQLITSEQLEKVAQKLQDFVGEMNKGLEFSVDKDSGRDVLKVIDKKSGDLIKQYPTEEVLDLVAKLSEATGNFINTDV